MSSSENPPSLSLSDIMHPMSPSPAPVEDQSPAPSNYDPAALQEPLTDSEASIIRNRLQELGLVMSYRSENQDLPNPRLGVANHLNLREKELIDMILRLTGCPRIDTTQLEEQAVTISSLTAQRDYLIAEAEQERLKLQSERENWNRTAEALLIQKTRPSKPEDTDAQRAAYETEIKSLREKLHDRHRRLSSLEQEILRLKPLLLMQPYTNKTMKRQDKGKRREDDAIPSSLDPTGPEAPQKFNSTTYPYGYQYKPEGSMPSGQPSNSHTFLVEGPSAPGPSSQRRRSKDHSNIQKGKKKHYRSNTMSDAYAEHVLLAAQKIGRRRASLVTGLQRLADREKGVLAREHDHLRLRKEQERLEKERSDRLASGTPSMAYYRPSEDSSPQRDDAASTPTASKTPKRGRFVLHHNANPGGANTPSPSTYVFVNTSATRMSKTPSAYSPGSIPGTPSRPDATSTIRSTHATNPPTPLDSLVDAARMMGESGDRSNARRRLLEEPESPTAKRRKVTSSKVVVNRGASKLSRVQSGLDVLADQAAAVKKPGQTSTQPPAKDSHTISDRKGKGKVDTQDTDSEWRIPSKTRSSTRTIRPSSRRLSAFQDSLPSASATMMGRGTIKTQGLSRRTDTPEPRVIALPTILSSGFDTSEVTRLGLNLRPVSGWGDRPVPDQDEDDSNSDSTCDSPTRNALRDEIQGVEFSLRESNAAEVNNPLPSTALPEMERVLAPSVTLGATHESSDANGYVHHVAGDSRDVAPPALTQSSIRQTPETGKSKACQPSLPVENPVSRLPSQEPSPQAIFGPVHADHRESEGHTADGTASDADEDAEGEEDEENTEIDAEVGSKYNASRSRSPPPPDPPGNDLPGNDQDPDADADGDMDVDDKETPPSGTSPPTHQTTQAGHHQQTVMDAPLSIKPRTFESVNPHDRA